MHEKWLNPNFAFFDYFQLVLGSVRMKGSLMLEPVCVAVQVVSVGLAVKVSAVNGTYTCVCIHVSYHAELYWELLCIVPKLVIPHEAKSPSYAFYMQFTQQIAQLGSLHSLSLCSDSDCIRVCQNGGTLDPGACACACAGGFSGPNCESECIVRRLASINVAGN